MGKLPNEVVGVLAVCRRVRTLLKAAALQRGVEELTKAKFCEMADIKRSTLSNWVKDVGQPQLDHAMKLCDAFDITLDWLYRGNTAGMPPSIGDYIKKAEGVGGSAAKSLEKPPPFAQRKSSRSR